MLEFAYSKSNCEELEKKEDIFLNSVVSVKTLHTLSLHVSYGTFSTEQEMAKVIFN